MLALGFSTVQPVLNQHQQTGRLFEVGGMGARGWEAGRGSGLGGR